MKVPAKAFYFVRHGETVLNAQNVIVGAVEDPLSEKGRSQARSAGAYLKEKSFCTLISSPRMRATETAELIAQQTGKPLIIEEGLSEKSWEKWKESL